MINALTVFTENQSELKEKIMLKEKIFNLDKNLKKKLIAFALLVILIVLESALCIEHSMHRAVVGFAGVSFDGMLFAPCTDYVLTNELNTSKLICKSKDGNWRIYAVKGYEKNLDYIRAQSLMNGHWYERVN